MRLALSLSVRYDLYWRLAGVSGRGQHLSLRLETGSYRGGREGGREGSLLASNTASCSCCLPSLPPLSAPELHGSCELGQTETGPGSQTWGWLRTYIGHTPLWSVDCGPHNNVSTEHCTTLSLNRKYFCDRTHLTVFLHHICIKCLLWTWSCNFDVKIYPQCKILDVREDSSDMY